MNKQRIQGTVKVFLEHAKKTHAILSAKKEDMSAILKEKESKKGWWNKLVKGSTVVIGGVSIPGTMFTAAFKAVDLSGAAAIVRSLKVIGEMFGFGMVGGTVMLGAIAVASGFVISKVLSVIETAKFDAKLASALASVEMDMLRIENMIRQMEIIDIDLGMAESVDFVQLNVIYEMMEQYVYSLGCGKIDFYTHVLKKKLDIASGGRIKIDAEEFIDELEDRHYPGKKAVIEHSRKVASLMEILADIDCEEFFDESNMIFTLGHVVHMVASVNEHIDLAAVEIQGKEEFLSWLKENNKVKFFSENYFNS